MAARQVYEMNCHSKEEPMPFPSCAVYHAATGGTSFEGRFSHLASPLKASFFGVFNGLVRCGRHLSELVLPDASGARGSRGEWPPKAMGNLSPFVE